MRMDTEKGKREGENRKDEGGKGKRGKGGE